MEHPHKTRWQPPAARAITVKQSVRKHTQAETALQISETRYRRLFEAAQDGILILDADTGRIADVNPFLTDMLGYPSEELLGKRLWEIGPVLDVERSKAAFLELQTKRYIRYENLPLQTRDGKSISVEFVSNVYRVDHKEVIQCNIRNITERKQEHADLLAQMNDAVVVSDEQSRITVWNAAAEAMYGWRAKEVLGGNGVELVRTQWTNVDSDEMRRVMAETGHWRGEATQQRKDGTRFPVEVASRVLRDGAGEITGYVSVNRDITERKRAEEALRENEQRLASVFATVGDVIYYLAVEPDGQYRFNSVNPAFGQVTGIPIEQVIGRKVNEIIPEPSLSVVLGKYRQAIEEKTIVRWEETSDYPTGRLIGEVSVAPVFDNAGNCINIVGLVHDITERKQAEEALHISEKRFRALIENSSDAIILASTDGKTIYRSPAAYRLLGLDPAAPQDNSMFRAVHPDDVKYVSKVFAQVFQAPGKPILFQYRAQHSDGSWRWVEGTGTNLLTEPAVHAIVVNYRDITERKQAEEALRESKERFRAWIENSSDLVTVVGLDGTIQYESPSIEHLLGYKPEELIGTSAFDLMHPDDLERIMEIFAQNTQAPESAAIAEFRFRHRDGSWRVFEGMGKTYLNEHGQTSGLVNSRDITARKRVEETLRQHLAELEAVHTISTALRAAQTRDEALPILLDETLTALETNTGAIWLYHADSGELHAAVTRGWYQQLSENPVKPGEGIAGTVFATGQSHITAEFARDPVARQPIAGQFPAGWGGVCLPIRTGAITVGTLTVSLPPPRQVTTEQMKLLESLTEMAGTTLHRMSLHEETVRQLDRLEALHRVDLAITASMDLHLTLNVLLEQVIAQLKADAADVLLLNPHTLTLEHAAGRGFRTHTAQTAHIRLGEDFARRAALERRTVRADDPAQVQNSPHFAALWASEGFATYFGVPLIAKGQVKGVLEVYHRAPFHPEPDWIGFLETLAGQVAIAVDNGLLLNDLEESNVELVQAYETTIEGWSRALDLRDKETEGHTQRVTEMALSLSRAMQVNDAELVAIRRGALLHDIGKMGVPDTILHKPGALDDAERKIMRQHPELAYQLLSPIAYLQSAVDIPYCHHEKWDGTGYPRGLKGDQIPLAARIFAVVDVWDALRSDRPYRSRWSYEKAREHIRAGAGTHFDPKVVEVFMKMDAWRDAEQVAHDPSALVHQK